MSGAFFETVSFGVLGKYAELSQQAKTERLTTETPLAFALAGLTIVSGSEREVAGYRELFPYEARHARTILRTATTAVARRLLRARPELIDEVRAHPYVKKKLTVGPFKRLSPADQAIKALQGLLADSRFFLDLQARGLLAWDDGDAQGAMAIVYGWHRTVTSRRGILESASHIAQGGRQVLANARRAHQENPMLHLIDQRTKLAWDTLSAAERTQSVAALEQIDAQAAQADRSAALRMMKLSSSVDLGLCLRQPQRVQEALDAIEHLLAPDPAGQAHLTLQRAWAAARGGAPEQARRLAEATSGDEFIQAQAVHVLAATGDQQSAASLRRTRVAQLSREFQTTIRRGLEFERP